MSYNRPHTFGFTGFQLPKRNTDNSKVFNAVPPPPSDAHRRGPSGGSGVQMGPPGTLNKQGYATMQAISHTALSANLGVSRKRATTEEEYFDEVEEETPALAYIPAPGSPSYVPPSDQGRYGDQSDSDEDPLDAFMAGIEKQVKTETVTPAQVKGQAKKGVRDDIDEEDVEESYYRYMEENPLAGTLDEGSDGEAIEYDEDGNPIAPPRKRHIDPLMPIDHSEMDYKPFDKNFYTPHEDIQALLPHQVAELRQALGIRVTGPSPPHPVSSFAHFGFDEPLMKAIRKAEYTQPSPIQAQAVPTALSGRDIIGIAKTGSGKTAAFIWPMLVHIMDQREISPGDGPIAVILAPTRELSVQIYNETRKFGRVYNIQVVCCYGGGSKWEQSKALEGGAEVVVATPGRMIDLVKMKATNLARVTYLVLDEADRMFDMGFEPQVRSICNHVRPDRQTLLFSATFKKRIERLVRDALTDPVRIVQGELGEANDDVTQIVKIFNSPVHKWAWLISMMVQLLSEGSVLVFVTKKADAEQVANNLILKEQECLLLHGDMDQSERNKVITQFKKKEVPVLVATDVAARGLDIPHIKNVVNYDIARDIDTHTHRIGRTGRAGEQGTAYTLLTDKDKEFAGHLVRNLEGANQEVPQPLLDLALQSSWFRKSRFKNTKGKTLNIGGSGLGFKERPGLGATDANNIDHSKAAASSAQESVPRVSKGPATDRLSAMREAFKSQYSNQFKASSDHSWEQIMQPHSSMPPPPGPPPSMPPPPCPRDQMGSKDNRKGKRSRWE